MTAPRGVMLADAFADILSAVAESVEEWLVDAGKVAPERAGLVDYQGRRLIRAVERVIANMPRKGENVVQFPKVQP